MSFTLLFSSYLFHFFPLPCTHIFSWCLLSLAVAWVATSWKYWFLSSLLFSFFFQPSSSTPPPPSSSSSLCCIWGSDLIHDQPTSLAAHPASFFCSLPFFLFFSLLIFSILTSRCGFALFKSTLHYGVAKSRSRGCEVVAGGGSFSPPSFHCILPYTSIKAAEARVQALGLLSTSATDDSFPLTTHK